jgi:hypothetical protein
VLFRSVEDVEEFSAEDFPHEGGGGSAEVRLVEMAAGKPMEETFLEKIFEVVASERRMQYQET